MVQSLIQIHDLRFKPYLPEGKILARVAELAKQISAENADTFPVFLVVLNGAFMFASDLLKHIPVPCEIAFIRSSSYAGTESTGELKIDFLPTEKIKNRNVIVVEDIVDTGNSLEKLLPFIREQQPMSVKIVSLLYKRDSFRGTFPVDYVGFEIPNAFVVGYGLDYNESGRNLRELYVLAE